MLVKRITENASYLVWSKLVCKDSALNLTFACIVSLKECGASLDVRPYILFERKGLWEIPMNIPLLVSI